MGYYISLRNIQWAIEVERYHVEKESKVLVREKMKHMLRARKENPNIYE